MQAAGIQRPERSAEICVALQRAQVVALLGPRQSGKTTLARSLQPDSIFDLEDSVDRQALAAAPQATLAAQRGLVVIDEIQTMPELLPILRVLADRSDQPARFLILGSAAPELDLLVPRGGKLFGFECKFADAPSATRSMHAAAELLGLAHLYVIYPGTRSYHLAPGITALPLREVSTTCRAL